MELQSGMKNGPVTLNLPDDASGEHARQESSNVERIETQEKRTRFSLSHDEGISITDILRGCITAIMFFQNGFHRLMFICAFCSSLVIHM